MARPLHPHADMNGEGTGGGGAVAVLLALWIAAVGFVVAQSPLNESSPVAGAPSGATPDPRLPVCTEGVDCDQPMTRIELAEALAQAFALRVATADYFTDDDGLPGEAAANRLAAAEITSGCREGLFCPDEVATRGHAASFLMRALGLDATTRNYFDDDDGSAHEAAINELAAAEITEGCGDGRFCPDEPLTRKMLIAFLERALDLDEVA
jgi:S-layer homology domain